MRKAIILQEWHKNGKITSRQVTKDTFIKAVDSIRRRRNGWQLIDASGDITDVESAFGQSVCFGLFAPSYYNEN